VSVTERVSTKSIDEIDSLMTYLFSLVANGLERATTAFLAHDRDAARALIAADTEFDTLQEEIEMLVEQQLAGRICEPDDLALLLAVVRIVPELERSGDLVEHIALRTGNGLLASLTPSTTELIEAMAEIGVGMWRDAAASYLRRDPDAADALRVRDDELDDLHVQLTAELAETAMPPATAIELGLIARFYERLGDHAVNVVRRLPRLSTPAPVGG
jgi:phosphate transport system protein